MSADIMWSSLQWWDEWQLRILVLCSLGLQWFLVLVVPMRNYTIQRWLRACIWLACICADVLAIYALATLLYRQAAGGGTRWWTSGFDDDDDSRAAQQGRSSLMLEALWAPLLLVHLGGREELTANDTKGALCCWVRHAAVLVTLTVYAFSTSLRNFSEGSGDDDVLKLKLLASAALLLVAAAVSSCGKPWALRRSSVRRLVATSSLAKGARKAKSSTKRRRRSLSERCFTELGDRYKCWKELKPRGTAPMVSQGDKVKLLLSGMSLHAARATLEPRRKKPEHTVLEPLAPPTDADVAIKPWLRRAFGLVHTRAAPMFTPAYLACHALLVPSLYVAAAVLLFAATRHKKHGYSSYSRYGRADVNTTYVLLCFTAALDVFGMFVSEAMYSLLSSPSSLGAKLVGASPCENLPGHSILDSVLWTIRRPLVSVLLLGCYKGGSFAKDKDGMSARVLRIITKLLDMEGNKDKNFDIDLSSYRSLSSKRNWILTEKDLELVCGDKYRNIRASLREKPFDESVLIWHIATELCFRVRPPKRFRFRPPSSPHLEREVCTEAISNYMAYLLDRRPEMLMAGSRQHLFTQAMANMERVVGAATEGLRPKLREKQPLDGVILARIKEEAAELQEEEAYSATHDACKLAEELLAVSDERTRWELMHRVWVGMLCYSAAMCGGDLHARSLGEGGEFLSNVWLLISLIGARTLEDRLQMPDDDEEPARDNKREQEAGLKKAAGSGVAPAGDKKEELEAQGKEAVAPTGDKLHMSNDDPEPEGKAEPKATDNVQKPDSSETKEEGMG